MNRELSGRSCNNCGHLHDDSDLCQTCSAGKNWEPLDILREFIQEPSNKNNKVDVVSDIGVPATLELCAEECVELAHAALKMARKLRGENPTPKSMETILEDLTEELGDVQINIDKILEYGIVPKKDVDAVKEYKQKRWEERLREKKRQLENSMEE